MRKSPIRKHRPGTRRGEPTKAEKTALRHDAYVRARGKCELVADCPRGVLPWDGDVFTRAHLVHLRARRRFGWGMENLAIGCFEHHRASHEGKLTHGKTYGELIAGRGIATP